MTHPKAMMPAPENAKCINHSRPEEISYVHISLTEQEAPYVRPCPHGRGRKLERSRTAVFIGTPCEVIDRYQSRCHIHQSVSCRVSCDTARPISFCVPVQDGIKEAEIDQPVQDGSEEGQLFLTSGRLTPRSGLAEVQS